MQDCSIKLEPHKIHPNKHPFFRLNDSWYLRFNVEQIVEWDPKVCKTARKLKIKRPNRSKQ